MLTFQVKVVRWMPDGDRLASYDSWGRLIIWRNRANVLAYELDIKTSLLVTDMQWSPCGYYLFLCGREGHVQSFSSINGLNLFSIQVEATNSNNKKAEFTCCAWNQPATRVALGTENGEVVIIDPSDNGRSISTICMHKGIPVQSLEWYGPVITCKKRGGVPYKSQYLSAYLKNGDVMLFESLFHSDVNCNRTGVVDGAAVWNSSFSLMAVIGYKKSNRCPIAKFLNNQGYVIFTLRDGLPSIPHERVSTSSY
jgi:WD40 repeat protein